MIFFNKEKELRDKLIKNKNRYISLNSDYEKICLETLILIQNEIRQKKCKKNIK